MTTSNSLVSGLAHSSRQGNHMFMWLDRVPASPILGHDDPKGLRENNYLPAGGKQTLQGSGHRRARPFEGAPPPGRSQTPGRPGRESTPPDTRHKQKSYAAFCFDKKKKRKTMPQGSMEEIK